MTDASHPFGRSLDELRQRFGDDMNELDADDILFLTSEHPDLPALEDLAGSRREEILAALAEREHWSPQDRATIAVAVTPPEYRRDRLSRVRDAAARLLALQRLLEDDAVGLCLRELDDGRFDVIVRVNPYATWDSADLRRLYGNNPNAIAEEDLLFVMREHPDRPALEDLVASRRAAVINAIQEGEDFGQHEGATLADAIAQPADQRDRSLRVRDAAARLLALQRLLDDGAVGLFLVELDERRFDAVLRVIPFEAAETDDGADPAHVAGADPDAP